jgi:hypothetical protein
VVVVKALRAAVADISRVFRGETLAHSLLRDRLLAVGVLSVGLDFLCAWAVNGLEGNKAGSDIHGFGDALFWTSTQLLTVSSQLKNPVSAGGKWLDVFMEAYAIVVVATLAGSFGAFFHHRRQQREAADTAG